MHCQWMCASVECMYVKVTVTRAHTHTVNFIFIDDQSFETLCYMLIYFQSSASPLSSLSLSLSLPLFLILLLLLLFYSSLFILKFKSINNQNGLCRAHTPQYRTMLPPSLCVIHSDCCYYCCWGSFSHTQRHTHSIE